MIINPYSYPTGGGGGGSGFALVANAESTGAAGGSTSASITTTGAKLIVLSVTYYHDSAANVVVSDSKSNTWTALTARSSSSAGLRLYYCINPTVGSGHTFTASGSATYATIMAQAYSCDTTPVYQAETGASLGSVTSGQGGSITPSENNCLIVTGLNAWYASGSFSIDSGFTISDSAPEVGGASFGSAFAYKIQTTAGAENPTWSWTTAAVETRIATAVFEPV